MLNQNYLKEKLDANKPALGTWCIINSPLVVDVIASSGIDFIIIDAEHGAISFETAQQMVIACESRNVSPIMRVGNLDESMILRALDIGIHGIQLPSISTVADAKKLVEFSKYPPIGIRGFSPFTKAGNYDFRNGKSLPTEANKNVLVIANLEGVEGIQNIEEIAKVDFLDVIFIGLFDLSKSMGIPGDVENPLVINALEKSVQVAHVNNKKIGTIASNSGMMKKFMDIGIDYLTYSVDTGIIKESYTDIVKSFKN
jgi:4-hydroxy-2-oxoheptanedioate aldolase